MIDYVLKLTRTPWDMRKDDVKSLRDAGLDDRAILDLAMIACYYAYVNRLADGLGVELEPDGPPHAGSSLGMRHNKHAGSSLGMRHNKDKA